MTMQELATPMELPSGWVWTHLADQVVFYDDGRNIRSAPFVAKYPGVPGFFASRYFPTLRGEHLPEFDSRIVGGPFKTLLLAIAAVRLMS